MNILQSFYPSSIPPAPINKMGQIPRFSNTGYGNLICSLSETERAQLEFDLGQVNDVQAWDMADKINRGDLPVPRQEMRQATVHAIKGYLLGQIDLCQLASFHLLDGGISDFVIDPIPQLFYEHKTNNSSTQRSHMIHLQQFSIQPFPTSYNKYSYLSNILQEEGIDLAAVDSSFHSPLLKRFFVLSDQEWDWFCQMLEEKPASERSFYTVLAPKYGGLHPFLSHLQQEVLFPIQYQKIPRMHSEDCILFEHSFIIPSFSMMQALVDVKAKSYGKSALTLVPSYGLTEEERYLNHKYAGQLFLSLYFPEHDRSLRYSLANQKYLGEVDGFPSRPTVSAIHDLYHALRENEMSEKHSLARFRLALLAHVHPNDRKRPTYKKVSALLQDGELIGSHPRTSYSPIRFTHHQPHKFGGIFYTYPLNTDLHPDLKKAMIQDMVIHADAWRENFDLGREDLLEPDQKIYDELQSP